MIDRSDEVKRALDYLSCFKEEMTSDKKHYTEVLIKEVKRLREENERLHEAIRGCDSMKCTWLYEGTYKEMTKHD